MFEPSRRMRFPTGHPLQQSVGPARHCGAAGYPLGRLRFRDSSAGEGWVPPRHLDEESGPATVITPHDTTELPTTVGEILTVSICHDESGWAWLQTAGGREGWVLNDAVEALS